MVYRSPRKRRPMGGPKPPKPPRRRRKPTKPSTKPALSRPSRPASKPGTRPYGSGRPKARRTRTRRMR